MSSITATQSHATTSSMTTASHELQSESEPTVVKMFGDLKELQSVLRKWGSSVVHLSILVAVICLQLYILLSDGSQSSYKCT
jgi:hypothetical protein